MENIKKDGLAKDIGSLLATLQHGADQVSKWAFHSIRRMGNAPVKRADGKSVVGILTKLGKGAFKVIGDMGTAYMEKYEELKRKRV